MRYLDKMMPYNYRSKMKDRKKPFLTKKMIEDYSKIYRYVPNFVEAEVH